MSNIAKPRQRSNRSARANPEAGSAVVDFVLTSFALLILFASAMAIVTNLYLRTVLTNAATDAARLMARADVSSSECEQSDTATQAGVATARSSLGMLIGEKLDETIEAATQKLDGLCTTEIRITANLPGLPLVSHITRFEATAHATLELQQ